MCSSDLRIDYLLGLYEPEINLVQFNLLDSHDTPRFITTAGGDLSALKLGWLFLFTYVGAPCLYYGDEIGLSGGPDPVCRVSFGWDNGGWDLGVIGYAKSIIRLRHNHPALRRGTFRRLYAKDNIYAFARRSRVSVKMKRSLLPSMAGPALLPPPSPPHRDWLMVL